MRKKTLGAGPHNSRRSTLSRRLETIRYLNDRKLRKIPIQAIADALVEEGYTSLDDQAKALGLHRATTWTIVKTKHKLGCLNTKTAQRILMNADTPSSVRAIIEKALAKSSVAAPRSGDVNK